MAHCIADADFSAMLSPISSSEPVVGDLRDNIAIDSSYQVLRNARTTARNNERSARNDGDTAAINSADWQIILETVPDVLSNQSKDIELVAWYIEGLTRKFGFKGLADGFALARQLIESYGDQLYPIPDEDGVESQLSSLAGLNGFGGEGALIYPIKAIAITQGDSPGPLAVWQCEQLLEADRITDVEKREAKFKQNGLSKSQLDDVLQETDTQFLIETNHAINQAIEEYKQFQISLDEYCGDDPLPTRQILDTLENCKKVLLYIAGDRLNNNTDVTAINTNDEEAVTSAEKSQEKSGTISGREDALQRLRDVANYFRRTEPHSPISYSIEQAVRWSGLPLTELIKELIPDDSARKRYQHLSGIDTANKDN